MYRTRIKVCGVTRAADVLVGDVLAVHAVVVVQARAVRVAFLDRDVRYVRQVDVLVSTTIISTYLNEQGLGNHWLDARELLEAVSSEAEGS